MSHTMPIECLEGYIHDDFPCPEGCGLSSQAHGTYVSGCPKPADHGRTAFKSKKKQLPFETQSVFELALTHPDAVRKSDVDAVRHMGELVEKTVFGRVLADVCEVCGGRIEVQIYKGSGVCCELHRKVRDGEMTLEQAQADGA
jgi:hypothetical protein